MKKNSFIPQREFETQRDYQFHNKTVKEITGNVDKYLISKFFGNGCKPYVIYRNMFPYIHKFQRHMVFWINPKYNKLYNLDRVKCIVKHNFPQYKNQIIFENIIQQKSVFGIKHFQLFLS